MKIALLVLLLVAIAAQFIRSPRNETALAQTNDLFIAQSAPEEVRTTIENSCYDCHSNRTHYPWYASIQPLSWWLARHVNQGKEAVNFSEFRTYSNQRAVRKLEESYEEVADETMPLRSYTWLHPRARLSPDQKHKILDWLDAAEARLEPDKASGD